MDQAIIYFKRAKEYLERYYEKNGNLEYDYAVMNCDWALKNCPKDSELAEQISEFKEKALLHKKIERAFHVAGQYFDLAGKNADSAVENLTKAIERYRKIKDSFELDKRFEDPYSCNMRRCYIKRAAAYLERGDYDSAIEDCTERINMGDDEGYMERAEIYLKKGDIDSAIEDYTKLTDMDDHEAYIERARIYFNRGNYNSAIEDCTKVEKILNGRRPTGFSSAKISNYSICANAYFKAGNIDAAVGYCNRVLEILQTWEWEYLWEHAKKQYEDDDEEYKIREMKGKKKKLKRIMELREELNGLIKNCDNEP